MMVPMLDEAIELAAAGGATEIAIGMAHRGRLNVLTHIMGVSYAEILAEFEGGASPGSALWVPDPGDRGRKVPSRRRGGLPPPLGEDRPGHPGPQSQPPGVRESGDSRDGAHAAVRGTWRGSRTGRRQRARGGDPERRRHQARSRPGRADPDPRGRRVRRRGRRRRNPQPGASAGLRGGRDHPHHRQQPGGLHDQPGRRPLHPLRERPRQGVRHPGHPRQRRRPRGMPRGDAARDGLPGTLPRRRGHRPDGLPAARPQRSRRTRLHAARPLQVDHHSSHCADAVGGGAGGTRSGYPGGRRREGERAVQRNSGR